MNLTINIAYISGKTEERGGGERNRKQIIKRNNK